MYNKLLCRALQAMTSRDIPMVAVLLLTVGVLALLRGCDTAGSAEPDQLVLVGRVIKVVDGDTIDVQLDSGPMRVRMQGIDTPERGQPMSGDAPAYLRDLVEGKEVELLPSGQTSYDRMVARVHLDGIDVNAEIIKRGLAMAERRFLHEFDDGESYCVFEHAARSDKRGIWRLPADQRIAPWEWRRRNQSAGFTNYGDETVGSCVAAIRGRAPAVRSPDDPDASHSWSCDTPKTCRQMASCEEAKFFLTTCGLSRLDGNDDGVPCENVCP